MITTPHIACSVCFSDRGLRLDAERIGIVDPGLCQNCGSTEGKKLPEDGLRALAHRFFVWGSLWRCKYGATPLIQFNQSQETCIDVSPWLAPDVKLFERLLGVGFFHYGPRLWMIGEVEPLKALQKSRTRRSVIDRILNEYPTTTLSKDQTFYRIRVAPSEPSVPSQYDSPPAMFAGKGRLDARNSPVLYGSSDLQICVHECRVTAEDEVYVATLAPKQNLRLLDLTSLLKEEKVTEFESLDMTVHMLFLAGKHAYKITREIADAARSDGFQGIIYPSYFSLLRLGVMPFQTMYGISHRRIPQYQEYEQGKAVPNLALFGRPIEEGAIAVECVNKLILSKVEYQFHFGPVAF
jgi:hypothetical protein